MAERQRLAAELAASEHDVATAAAESERVAAGLAALASELAPLEAEQAEMVERHRRDGAARDRERAEQRRAGRARRRQHGEGGERLHRAARPGPPRYSSDRAGGGAGREGAAEQRDQEKGENADALDGERRQRAVFGERLAECRVHADRNVGRGAA